MNSHLTDQQLANELATRYPQGVYPVFANAINEQGQSLGVDIINGPIAVIDETDCDYSLKADQYINAATPPNTKRAYIGDIQYFMQWQIAVFGRTNWPVTEEITIQFIFHHLQEMPVEVENHLLASGWKKRRGLHSVNTVKRRLVSVSIWHNMNGKKSLCDSPKVKSLLSAMVKTQGKQKKSKAITKNVLENLLVTCSDNSLISIRDKALLLFGWASGGRRRSEIANAVFENLEETEEGDFIYTIAKSKTDQSGKGHDVPIKGLAATALREWLKLSDVTSGNLFRSVSKGGTIGKKITDVDINRIVKKRCEKAGYDPSLYSAHSLRRGFITEAGKQGCPLGDAMALTGHKSVNIAMGYYESGAVINNKAANLML